MEVQNVYRDASGQWHIEYSSANLMGLALRVYLGQFLICICFLPFMILIAVASAKSIHEQPNITPSSNSNVPQKSVCQQISN
jgi:hypothetical protein